jgi:hypothetical protein
MNFAIARFEVRKESVGHFEELHVVALEAAKIKFKSVEVWELSGHTIVEKVQDLILRVAESKIDAIHIEWIHDCETSLVYIDKILSRIGIKWTGTGSVSHALRGKNRDPRFLNILGSLSKSKSLSGLFVWDDLLQTRISHSLPQLFPLADFQNVEVIEIQGNCCKWKARQSRPVIGVVGQLHSYRGVGLLLRRYRRFPRDPILLVGRFQKRDFSWGELISLQIGRIFRFIYFAPEWVENPAQLNHFLRHLDALVIDTNSYPQPSGIAVRARHFGIPVLIGTADSHLLDKASMDSGILPLNLLHVSSKNLTRELADARKAGKVRAPSRKNQIASFLAGWKRL